MLLALTALALLMVWTGSLVRADDNTVPATEMASDTDAISETGTEGSTEITTSENTESSTEVNTESTTESTTTASTETSEATTEVVQEAGFISEDYFLLNGMAGLEGNIPTVRAGEYMVSAVLHGYYGNIQASMYAITPAEGIQNGLGLCCEHGVPTAGADYDDGVLDGDGTKVTKVNGLTYAGSREVYNNLLKAWVYGHYGTEPWSECDYSIERYGDGTPILNADGTQRPTAAHKRSIAIQALALSYYNTNKSDSVTARTAISSYTDVMAFVAYCDSKSVPLSVYDDDNCTITAHEHSTTYEGYLASEYFVLEGVPAGMSYNLKVPSGCKVLLWPSYTSEDDDYTEYSAGSDVTLFNGNCIVLLGDYSLNGTSTSTTLTCNNTLYDLYAFTPEGSNVQTVLIAYTSSGKSLSLSTTWEGMGSIQIEKYYLDPAAEGNPNYDKKATYTVTNAEGTLVGTLVTDATTGLSPILENLPYGTYTVKETVPSMNCDLDPDTHTVTLTAQNSTATTPVVVRSGEPTDYSWVKVKKASSNPVCTDGNSLYSLAGTEYRLYTDSACTKPALDTDGKEVIFVCDENGNTTAREMLIGTYYLKETVAGKGYIKDERVPITSATLTADNTEDNPYVFAVTNEPVFDPVDIVLTKSGDANKKLQGAIYCVEFYPGVQSYNEEAIKTTYSGTPRKWYLETDENGRAHFDTTWVTDEPGFVSDEFYLDAIGMPTFPLGSIIIYEAKAPGNFKKDPTHFTYKVMQTGAGDEADVFKLENGQDVPAGALNASNELEEGFTDEPLFANLTIKKVPTDPSPMQGNTGDVTLDGAIFAVYAKRDIVCTASGEVVVKGGETFTKEEALKFEDGSVVKDVYGYTIMAKPGDPVPVAVLPATDENGETRIEGLYAAANADDYYVLELAPPSGFEANTNAMSVDLRDNTDKTTVLEAIEYKYEFGDDYQTQTLEVMKYTIKQEGVTPKLETVNGVKFKLYLISALKHKEDAIKLVQDDGTVVYDFTNYDFSDETPVVVKADGSTELIMGSNGKDGYDETIPLLKGEYVLVETYTPEHLEPVAPEVISMPKYMLGANGTIQVDDTHTSIIYNKCDANILNETVMKLVKLNKKNEQGKFVIHSNATFSVWDVSDLANAETASIEEIKANAERVSQYKYTETGLVPTDTFVTNSEGFIIFFSEFEYGKYAIIEEEAPVGYTLSKEPVLFDVKSEALYLLMDDKWEEANRYYDAANREYWEVDVVNVDYEINAAKFDSDTGKYLPNAELTIYKAVDENGNIALDENNNPIVLEAENEAGELVKAVWTTDDTWVKFNAVPSGYYVLRETKTPAGYATRKDITLYVGDDPAIAPNGVRVITGEDTIYYSFEKTDDGVKFVNTDRVETDSVKVELAIPNDIITVELSKKDASTDGELPGAELTLYRVTEGEDDELIETWVSESTPHVVKGLTPGWYKLVENTVPLGYYTEDNTIEFEVTDTNEIQKQHMLNHPLELKVTKESFKAGTPVAGATLSLYRKSDGKCLDNCDFDPDKATMTDAETGEPLHLVETWISTTEPHVISKLYPGEYVLVEELAPHGYTTADPIEFTVTDQSRIAPIAIYDEIIEIYVQIHKTGESLVSAESVESEYGDYTKFVWDDVNLEGVQFDVKNTDGEVVATLITDENGIATSQQLGFGDYTVEEQVPYGMIDDGVIYKISYKWIPGMQEENLTASLEVYNESCNTQVNVNKIAEEAILKDGEYQYVTKPLEGALFAVYAREDIENYYGEIIAKSGTCLGYAVTDEAGVASFNDKLIKGNYYYTELKSAGPQYVLDSQIYNFDLLLENSKTNVFNLNESFPVTNNLVKGDIEVLKIAEDGKVPLAGVEFDLYNSDNVVIDHLTTGTDGKAKTKVLPYGKYYLKETKALEGYQLEDTKFEVTVVEDGVTTVVTIENRKTPKLGVTTMVTITGLMLILGILVMSVLGKFKRIKDEE